jgi:PAS domain S-box-containing protein
LQGNENFKDLQFIQKLYDVSPALITLLDITTGKYLYVNKRAQDILGFSSEEILAGGREMMNSLIHNEDVKQLLQRRSEAIEDANKNFPTYDDSSVVEFEYRVRHKNGNYKWLHNYGSIFSRNAKNKVEQILNVQ